MLQGTATACWVEDHGDSHQCTTRVEFLAVMFSQHPRQALFAPVEPCPFSATDELQWRCVHVWEERERNIKRSLLVCLWGSVRFMFNACVHICAPVHRPLLLVVYSVKSAPGSVLHSLKTPHRCWDACLCIAAVRKCHCWHVMRASGPTQACLRATCGPTSSAADTGSLVCSSTIACHAPPKSACLACAGPVRDQSGEHNSIYWGVFDWQPWREGAAMQLHRPSWAARLNTKLTLKSPSQTQMPQKPNFWSRRKYLSSWKVFICVGIFSSCH